jgi:hypothetical protein
LQNKTIKKINLILTFVLIVIVVSNILISNFMIHSKKEELNKAEAELEFLKEIKQFYHSRTHRYYNPTYEEAFNFVNASKTSDIHNVFIKAEKQGLDSIIVQTIMGEELLMYELIAFNTTDMGLVCFEPDTAYEVKPEIGKSYIDCVVGLPYSNTTFNDTIRDILIIY